MSLLWNEPPSSFTGDVKPHRSSSRQYSKGPRRSSVPQLQGPSGHVPTHVCSSTAMHTPQVTMCLHICADLQAASHVSSRPPHACSLVCAHLGSRCRGEGRVLAHTPKQHHELLLPAYLKIATVKKSGQAQPWGREGWVEAVEGTAQPLSSPIPASPVPFCPGGEFPEFSPGSYSQSSSLSLNERAMCFCPIYPVSVMG